MSMRARGTKWRLTRAASAQSSEPLDVHARCMHEVRGGAHGREEVRVRRSRPPETPPCLERSPSARASSWCLRRRRGARPSRPPSPTGPPTSPHPPCLLDGFYYVLLCFTMFYPMFAHAFTMFYYVLLCSTIRLGMPVAKHVVEHSRT